MNQSQQFLRVADLCGTRDRPGSLKLSRSTLWRLVADGRFPRPVKLGPRITAWRSADVAAWSESLSAKGDQ